VAAAHDVRVKQRLFLALLLPDTAAADLSHRLAPLSEDIEEPIRWRSRRQWHITVAFLGPQRMDRRELICRSAAGAAQMTTVGPLRLQGCGRFNTALWLGVATGDWLSDLSHRLNTRLGESADSRNFHGHVTVARSPQRVVPHSFTTALQDYSGPEWVPDRLVLVRSVLGAAPHYQHLLSWPFIR
jgi:2'-5' RNA ligase